MKIFCTSALSTVHRLIHSSCIQLCRPQIHFALLSVWCGISLSSGYPEDSFYVDIKVSEYSDGDKKTCLGVKQQCSLFKKDPPINIFKLTIDQMTVCNVRSCSDKATCGSSEPFVQHVYCLVQIKHAAVIRQKLCCWYPAPYSRQN